MTVKPFAKSSGNSRGNRPAACPTQIGGKALSLRRLAMSFMWLTNTASLGGFPPTQTLSDAYAQRATGLGHGFVMSCSDLNDLSSGTDAAFSNLNTTVRSFNPLLSRRL